MVKLLVDNREIEAEKGMNLLQACLDNNIYVPNLCYLEGLRPPASCRMCFVEIEGKDRPVASCTVEVSESMVVRTETPTVRRLQRTAFRLLLSVHDVDCKNCPATKKCELQRLARFLKVGLTQKHLETFLKEPDAGRQHPFLDYYPNRCILCGKCVHACRRRHGQSMLTFARRGFDTIISAYGEDDAPELSCEKCAACVDICPVAAISFKGH
jgi:NADH dehydrogenase/NADH:ubiquinone oxidoreductase subunit G